MNLFWKDLNWGFVAKDLYHFFLYAIKNVDSFDDLTGVLLEQEDKELIFILFQNVNQFLSFPSVKLPGQTSISDGVDHDFQV